MSESTAIGWTDSTFNGWWGCVEVSPGCAHCYAKAFAKRVGQDVWGEDAARRSFGDKHWDEPRKWNAAAAKAGRRHRVFTASMSDVFDRNAPDGARDRLWVLIRETPWLDWQVLTKRPENAIGMLPSDWGDGYENVWLGCTVEDQKRADERLPILLAIQARTKFVSYEPALEAVDLRAYLASDNRATIRNRDYTLGVLVREIDQVIIGAESGGKARPFDPAWADDVIAQCRAAGTAVFVKQDSGVRAGQQGRFRDEVWALKEFPRSVAPRAADGPQVRLPVVP